MIEIHIQTMPFANQDERDIHFRKHGHKFGAADPAEYETMTDSFMYGAMTMSMAECTRPNMIDRQRYNYMNRHFGVASRLEPVFVKTFYPISLHTVAHHGGPVSFFAYECGRTEL
jgi:hypothetical protein